MKEFRAEDPDEAIDKKLDEIIKQKNDIKEANEEDEDEKIEKKDEKASEECLMIQDKPLKIEKLLFSELKGKSRKS